MKQAFESVVTSKGSQSLQPNPFLATVLRGGGILVALGGRGRPRGTPRSCADCLEVQRLSERGCEREKGRDQILQVDKRQRSGQEHRYVSVPGGWWFQPPQSSLGSKFGDRNAKIRLQNKYCKSRWAAGHQDSTCHDVCL